MDENGEETPCFRDGLYSAISGVRLPRRDPVAVDHVQTIQVDEEKTLQLKTRSVKPPLFEIPGVLSDEECDHLVELANTNGLEDSTPAFKGERVTREGVNSTLTSRQMGIYCKRISRSDKNKDGNITVHEFNDYVYRARNILVTLKDVWSAYETLLLEGASYITYENCTRVNRTQFVEFVYRLFNMYRFPYYNERHSMHTWVEFNKKDPVLERIKRRVAEVTQISTLQIEHSEDLQVVKYQQGGHYYAHYDSSVGSEIQEKRCCQKFEDRSQSSCLICRYITVLFYLNNVTKGGETAFPVADHEELLSGKNYSSNLSKRCKKASLIVKPVKGSALFWYNHVLEEESGMMGEVDLLSLHGGCDVFEGEKWVANLWINAPRVDQTV